MERRKRTTANRAKDPCFVWEALDLLKEEDWSPKQISADMKKRGENISHELISTVMPVPTKVENWHHIAGIR